MTPPPAPPSRLPDGDIRIGGGDTATPLNLAKRVALLEATFGLRGKRVLDAGCGAGEYVEAFVARGADAIGFEFEAAKVLAYQRLHPGSDRVRQGELTGLPLPDESFDLVILNEVLEHTPDQAGTLAELRRVLRPGGHLVIFAPNRLFPFETHGVLLRSSGRSLSPWIPGIPYLPIAWGSRWFHYWARNYWPGELRQLIREAGFTLAGENWVWQTFENISGRRPRWVTPLTGLLRRAVSVAEVCPIVRRLGTSQVVWAKKPPHAAP